MMFQIETFLIQNNIEYRTQGKNIGRGEINICCPFCSESHFHFGINPNKGVCNCWICGQSSNITKLIAKIKGITYIEALAIINEKSDLRKAMEDRKNKVEQKKIDKTVITNFSLPKYSYPFLKDRNDTWQSVAYSYIRNKYDIDFDTVINAKLHYCCHGDYRNSIIIPIYRDNKLVNFVSRKWDKNAKQRYKNCPNELAVLYIKKTVYNYDNIKKGQDLLVIVEGIFSALKVGLNRTVATFGTKTTEEQLKLIIGLNAKKTVILFDNDLENNNTWKEANEIANYLSTFINVKAIRIPYADKDPADLTKIDIDNLINK